MYDPGTKTRQAAETKARVKYQLRKGRNGYAQLMDLSRLTVVFADCTLLVHLRNFRVCAYSWGPSSSALILGLVGSIPHFNRSPTLIHVLCWRLVILVNFEPYA